MKNYQQKDVWMHSLIVATLGLTVVGSLTLMDLVAFESAAILGLTASLVPVHLNR